MLYRLSSLPSPRLVNIDETVVPFYDSPLKYYSPTCVRGQKSRVS